MAKRQAQHTEHPVDLIGRSLRDAAPRSVAMARLGMTESTWAKLVEAGMPVIQQDGGEEIVLFKDVTEALEKIKQPTASVAAGAK